MKLITELSWNVSESEYRANAAYSYSTLSRFYSTGFSGLNKLYDKVESQSLLFGSVVDSLLTDGDEFYDKYIITTMPKISDSLINISKALFEEFKDKYRSVLNIPDECLAATGEKYDYYSNDKYKSYRVKLIKENCKEYYELLFLSENKTIIDSQMFTDAQDCVNELKLNEFTKKYFTENPLNDNLKIYYQLKFKSSYNGIRVRCMCDCLLVDYDKKLIIPVDLKTSFNDEWNFYESFITWKYSIQARLYWYIIKSNLDADEYFKDFKLDDYKFIVINKVNKKPLVWNYSDSDKIGDIYYPNNTVAPDWRKLLENLNHYELNKPKYPIGIKDVNEITEYLNKTNQTKS